MDRWNWIGLRAFGPGIAGVVMAFLSMVALSRVVLSPYLAGVIDVVRWVPLLALAWSLWLILAPAYRLWQWRRGAGLSCPHCAGPLGHERSGYASRGGAYRRCYACGNNINHRHYE